VPGLTLVVSSMVTLLWLLPGEGAREAGVDRTWDRIGPWFFLVMGLFGLLWHRAMGY